MAIQRLILSSLSTFAACIEFPENSTIKTAPGPPVKTEGALAMLTILMSSCSIGERPAQFKQGRERFASAEPTLRITEQQKL